MPLPHFTNLEQSYRRDDHIYKYNVNIEDKVYMNIDELLNLFLLHSYTGNGDMKIFFLKKGDYYDNGAIKKLESRIIKIIRDDNGLLDMVNVKYLFSNACEDIMKEENFVGFKIPKRGDKKLYILAEEDDDSQFEDDFDE